MRIGIEAQRLFRRKKHGMEVVALELINHLQLIDKENEYVIFVKDGDDRQCLRETKNFKIRILNSLSYADWEQYRLPKAASKEKIDFLHCTSNTAPLNLKVPLLVTVHDLIYLESLSFGGSAYQNFGNIYRRIVVPNIAKKAKKIITVSNFERENIIRTLKVSEAKIETVYNGKRKDFRKINSNKHFFSVKQKYNLPENFLFFLGNTSQRKNTLGVLRAFEEYSKQAKDHLSLVLTSLEFSQIKALAEKNNINFRNIEKHIFCIGYVDHEDLPVLYNLASIFLFPSLREGFGLPIIEAMACEVPVITSKASSMPEVAGCAAILINPENPKEIADAILKLSGDPQLKEKCIINGIERAKVFEWQNTAEHTLNIYKQFYREHVQS